MDVEESFPGMTNVVAARTWRLKRTGNMAGSGATGIIHWPSLCRWSALRTPVAAAANLAIPAAHADVHRLCDCQACGGGGAPPLTTHYAVKRTVDVDDHQLTSHQRICLHHRPPMARITAGARSRASLLGR